MEKHAVNKITVYVGGRRFTLVSADKEEYVRKIAENVDKRIEHIAKVYPQLDMRGCAVLAALDFADDEQKALGRKGDITNQADKVLRQADKQSKQISRLKKQSEQMLEENTRLEEAQKQLREKYSELSDRYNELKKFLDKQVNLSKNQTPKTTASHAQSKQEEKNRPDEKRQTPKAQEKNSSQSDPSLRTKKMGPLSEELLKPETAADIAHKGYTPMRQYSLFDDDER